MISNGAILAFSSRQDNIRHAGPIVSNALRLDLNSDKERQFTPDAPCDEWR
jgi:hypothetical protein